MNKLTCLLVRALLLSVFLLSITFSHRGFSQSITSPSQHFGFQPGADGMLFNYERMIDYFKLLEKQCNRLKTIQIGNTPLGRPLFMVCISSEENIANLNELKEINRKLALDYTLNVDEVNSLKAKGKVFVLGTLSMHSNEVAPSQASPLIAYKLVTSNGADTLRWLENVVYMMVPCHNPDGMNMVNENYMKNKGTKYEGTNFPGIYHKYAGHNINRDFVMLTQPENKAISALTSKDWYPQVMVEKHQMGFTGARYFVPPNHDPIAQNIDETLWSWIGLFGANMVKDMTALGKTGITQRYIFDNYWPGSTETCLWKNVIAFLTEAASVKTATPVFVEKNELKVWGKGLSEYKKGANLIAPWEGGWWRLSDIVDYEVSSTFSILKTSSMYRDFILQHRNDICKKEYSKGLNQPPYYYILPKRQNDESELGRLICLLIEHGVVVNQLSAELFIGNTKYNAGDYVVPLAQPFRAFIKEVLEKQDYPERRYTPNGEVIKPYDVTSWSLPLTMGVEVIEINTRLLDIENRLKPVESSIGFAINSSNEKYLVFNVSNNESYRVAFTILSKGGKVFRVKEDIQIDGKTINSGSFAILSASSNLLDGERFYSQPTPFNELNISLLKELTVPKIALVETWFHDMDAGWTRYLFDTYNIPYKVIRPNELEDPNQLKDVQIVVFPNQNSELLVSGKRRSGDDYFPMNLPPEFARGMGKKGKENILKFIDGGGKVLAWGRSTELFMGMQEVEIDKDKKDEFTLPVSNVVKNLTKNGFEVSGAHVSVNVIQNHPLTLGYGEKIPIFFDGDAVFETQIPYFDTDRKVILSFPEGNPRLSGYLKSGEILENKAAMVWVRKNKGQLILFAFNPQYRGQTSGTFKLLFNAMLVD